MMGRWEEGTKDKGKWGNVEMGRWREEDGEKERRRKEDLGEGEREEDKERGDGKTRKEMMREKERSEK